MGQHKRGSPREAAHDADAILLAVHWSCLDEALHQAGDLHGKALLTCSLPMNDANTELVVAHISSGAEETASRAPGAHVVSAFGSVPSEVLFEVFAERGRAAPPSLAYCGDDQAAKATAARLIRDAGFDPVDASPLRTARYLEPFTLLIGLLAYEGDKGPELAYRFEWLGGGA